MPFQELKEGATHYLGDGCPEEHGITHHSGRFPLDTFTGETRKQIESMMDAYAEENIQTERERIFTLVCRIAPEYEEDFRKIILGNRK